MEASGHGSTATAKARVTQTSLVQTPEVEYIQQHVTGNRFE